MATGIVAFISGGEAVETAIKVLFIAGFGPIVGNPVDSHKLYCETLGIRFKEESGEYLHTEALKGANGFIATG